MIVRLLSLSVFFFSASVFADTALPAPECHKVSDPGHRAFEYCVRRPASGAGAGVVYFLHGRGGSASGAITEIADPVFATLRLGARAPWLVAISYGSNALVATTSVHDRAVPTTEVNDYALPLIERELGIAGRPDRHLLGLSLGGFNAIDIFGDSPAKFSSLALLCPAVVDINPFDKTQVDDFKKRNAAILDPGKSNLALMIVQFTFQDEAHWNISNPMAKIRSGVLAGKPAFVSIGSEDDYGFFEGTEHLSKELDAQGVVHDWAPVPGKHCSYDGQKLGDYFTRVLR